MATNTTKRTRKASDEVAAIEKARKSGPRKAVAQVNEVVPNEKPTKSATARTSLVPASKAKRVLAKKSTSKKASTDRVKLRQVAILDKKAKLEEKRAKVAARKLASKKAPIKTSMASMLKSFKRCFNTALDAIEELPALYYGRQTVVALRYGVSQTAARKWLEGDSMPDLEHLVMIADNLGLSVDSLLGRSSTFVSGAKNKLKLHQTTSSLESDNASPLIDTVEFDNGLLRHTMRLQQNGVELFRVTTDSLAPSLNVGDIAFVDTSASSIIDGGLYLFITQGGRILLRRANHQIDGTVLLSCHNREHQNLVLKGSDIGIGDAKGRFKLKLFGSIPWRITKLSGGLEVVGQHSFI